MATPERDRSASRPLTLYPVMRYTLRMNATIRAFAIIAAIACATPFRQASCDEYYSERGFSIDLPEGFVFLGGDGSSKFSFGLPDGSVEIDLIAYPDDRFASARDGAEDTARRLSGRGAFASFDYQGRGAAFGELTFGSGRSAMRGYGLFVNDVAPPADSAGAPYDLVVLAYAPADGYDEYADFVASAIDGFSIDYGRRAAPGPLGTAGRAALGAARPRPVTLRFGKAEIRADWNPAEAALSQQLVEREYRVLTAYGQSPELIDAAIARFYRMAFRDAAPSLDRLALELSAAWESGAWAGARPGPSLGAGATEPATAGPRFGATAEPRGYAEALLGWVQGFAYERDPAGSDVVNPISAAFEGRGDCDSRALVMAILLRRENIRSILMVSLVHEHALAAVDAPGAGARFPFEGGAWLVAETTATVGLGMIDSAQADPSAWIGVAFPF